MNIKMKHIAILTVILAAGLCCSCKNFLDVNPEGEPTTTTYFTNDSQSIDAIDALYRNIYESDYYGNEMYREQGGANIFVWGRTRKYPTLATLSYTGDESPIRGVFDLSYKWMADANWVILKLKEKYDNGIATDIEKRSLGEAYFMRAFYHFIIAYRYGTDKKGVPFVRYEDGNYNYDIPPQQESVVDNYKMIIKDLETAENLLPAFEDYAPADQGRAHKAACVAYMVKVYAYWAIWDKTQWEKVITCVDKLESVYGRNLTPDFSTLFSCDFNNYFNCEYLWSCPSTGGDRGCGIMFPTVVLENKAWGVYNGYGQNKPSLDIYEEFLKDGVGNSRLKKSILEYGDEFVLAGVTRRFYSTSDFEAGFQVNKFMDPFKNPDLVEGGWANSNSGGYPTTRQNWHFIRFAECLLFRAEANVVLDHPDKATTDINRVRERSNLTPLDRNATMLDIYHERCCELAFEAADHLFDIKRWAVSGSDDIKAVAIAELEAHPRVRKYTNRADPDSDFTVGPYDDYQSPAKVWSEHKLVFPYPSLVVKNSAGKLTQNAGYAQ